MEEMDCVNMGLGKENGGLSDILRILYARELVIGWVQVV